MNGLARAWRSSLGKKYIMAITGCALFLFVIGHLLGNLQVFLPDHGEALNAYGHFLQSKPGLVWTARLGLLAMLVLHVASAAKLSAENKRARPIGYEGNPAPLAASYASRTMMMSGLIVAAFVVYHLLHFTVQTKAINLTGQDFVGLVDAKGRHDVFRMMVAGFQQPLVSGFYVVAMALLCLHLSHGTSAMFQSVGLKERCCGPSIDRAARVVAWLIFAGYASIPAAVLLGYGKEVLK
jgi:succinate dehydrogenase / fumarate reductase cytochrome b subunit